MFNPAGLGSVATSAKHKQDLKASQATPVEAKEYTIQWPGSPVDGLTATLHSSIHGECIVILANGRSLSVPPSSLVAAPSKRTQDVIERTMRGEPEKKKAEKKEDKKDEKKSEKKEEPKKAEKEDEKKDEKKADAETDKSKKVVPDDKPDTRGAGLQEEELTDRAKSKSTEIEKPPVLEHMKKGPNSVPVETARTAEEASGKLKTLVAAAEAAQVATAEATAVAKAAQAKVGEAKSAESEAIKIVIDEMEKTDAVVKRITDRLVALDAKKDVASVNIPKSGSLRMRYEQALSLLKSIQDQAKEQAKVVKEVEAEAEEQYGATYNVQKRVSLFPASLQGALKTAASFSDLIKGLADWVKGIFGMAEAAETAVDALESELGGNPQESAVEAAKKVKAGRTTYSVIAPYHGESDSAWVVMAYDPENLDDFEVEKTFRMADGGKQAADSYAAQMNSGVNAAKKGDQYAEVVKLMQSLYGLEPNDWGGEEEIRKGMHGESAKDYVARMAEKHDLESLEDFSGGPGYGHTRGSKMTDKGGDWVSKKIAKLVAEGKPQKQAVAIAMSMARQQGYKGAEKVEATFATFQASLKARTGLKASEAGIKDEATFKARVAPMGVNAWVSGFIKKHGLNDLAPRFKADYDTATMEYKHDRGTEQGGPPTSVDLGTKPKMPKQTDRSGPYGRNSALPGIKILLGNYDGSTTSIVEMTTYNPTHDSFVDFESGNSNAIDVQHIVNNIVSPYFEPKGHGVWMTDSSPFEGSDSDNEGWAELERDIMSALKDAGHRVESEGAGSFDLIYVDMPDSFTVNGGKRNRLAPRAMGKKNPTDPMAKHPSWAKYGAKFPWQKILSADEINMVPEIKAIPGYDANQGAWFPQESREGLINWVTAHPEFDLVTQLDEGDDVYGLAVVNRDWYKLGLRDNAARTKWFGAA